MSNSLTSNLNSDFTASAKTPRSSKPMPAAPFSIRFTDEERARLRRDAGALSLAAYIRLKLFCDGKPDGSKRNATRKRNAPSVELTMISQLLGALGQSRLSSNLNQIAKAANVGALPVSPELESELQAACADVRAMRETLIVALGLKSEA